MCISPSKSHIAWFQKVRLTTAVYAGEADIQGAEISTYPWSEQEGGGDRNASRVEASARNKLDRMEEKRLILVRAPLLFDEQY
jgi:hypothetical protein